MYATRHKYKLIHSCSLTTECQLVLLSQVVGFAPMSRYYIQIEDREMRQRIRPVHRAISHLFCPFTAATGRSLTSRHSVSSASSSARPICARPHSSCCYSTRSSPSISSSTCSECFLSVLVPIGGEEACVSQHLVLQVGGWAWG